MGLEAIIRGLVRVRSTRTWSPGLLTPPGIVTGVGYASGDALGTQFTFDLPKGAAGSGSLRMAEYFDNDNEGLQVNLILARKPLTVPIADNAAFSYVANSKDLEQQIGEELLFSVFQTYSNAQKSVLYDISEDFDLGDGRTIYVQAKALGALNIAAGALPSFRLTFSLDF